MPSKDDLIYPMITPDNKVVAYGISAATAEDELVVPLVTSDNKATSIRASSMTTKDEVGWGAMSSDDIVCALISERIPLCFSICNESDGVYFENQQSGPNTQQNRINDVALWDSLVLEHKTKKGFMLIGNDPQFGINSLWLTPPDIPEDIPVELTVASPTFDDYIRFMKIAMRSSSLPTSVIVRMDDSGAQGRAMLEPGITEFEDFLIENDIPVDFTERSGERWLLWIGEAYQTFVDEGFI